MIYVIQSGVNGPIKVGYTSGDLKSRIDALQTGNHEPLKAICRVSYADMQFEREVHRVLADHHIRGEWFRWCPLARRVVEALAMEEMWETLAEPPEFSPFSDILCEMVGIKEGETGQIGHAKLLEWRSKRDRLLCRSRAGDLVDANESFWPPTSGST
jgi:hypothetical protein